MKRLLLYFLACVGVLGQPTTTTTITLRTKADITAFTVYSWQTNLNAIALEEGNSLYRFHPGSAATADGSTILNATGVAGKWIVEPTALVGGGTDASTAPVAARNLSVPQYVADYAALAAVDPDTGPSAVVVTDSLTGGLFVPVAGGTYATNAGCVFTNTASGKLWVRREAIELGILRSAWFPASTLSEVLTVQQAEHGVYRSVSLSAGSAWTISAAFNVTKPVRLVGESSAFATNAVTVTCTGSAFSRGLNMLSSDVAIEDLHFITRVEAIGFEIWKTTGTSDIERIEVRRCKFTAYDRVVTNARFIGSTITYNSATDHKFVVRGLVIEGCTFDAGSNVSDTETLTDPTLDDPTQWTPSGAEVSVTGGAAVWSYTGAGAKLLTSTNNLVSSNPYRYSATFTSMVNARVSIVGQAATVVTYTNSPGVKVVEYGNAATNPFQISVTAIDPGVPTEVIMTDASVRGSYDAWQHVVIGFRSQSPIVRDCTFTGGNRNLRMFTTDDLNVAQRWLYIDRPIVERNLFTFPRDGAVRNGFECNAWMPIIRNNILEGRIAGSLDQAMYIRSTGARIAENKFHIAGNGVYGKGAPWLPTQALGDDGSFGTQIYRNEFVLKFYDADEATYPNPNHVPGVARCLDWDGEDTQISHNIFRSDPDRRVANSYLRLSSDTTYGDSQNVSVIDNQFFGANYAIRTSFVHATNAQVGLNISRNRFIHCTFDIQLSGSTKGLRVADNYSEGGGSETADFGMFLATTTSSTTFMEDTVIARNQLSVGRSGFGKEYGVILYGQKRIKDTVIQDNIFTPATALKQIFLTPSDANLTGVNRICNNYSVIAGVVTGSRYSANMVTGSTSAEGFVTAYPGSLAINTNGFLEIKRSGTGNTGWNLLATGSRSFVTTQRTSLDDSTDMLSGTGNMSSGWTGSSALWVDRTGAWSITRAIGEDLGGTLNLTNSTVLGIVPGGRYSVVVTTTTNVIGAGRQVAVLLGGTQIGVLTNGVSTHTFTAARTEAMTTRLMFQATQTTNTAALDVCIDTVTLGVWSSASILHEHTYAAAALVPSTTAGPMLRVSAGGNFATNANAKAVVLAFAGATGVPQVIQSLSSTNSGPWRLTGQVHALANNKATWDLSFTDAAGVQVVNAYDQTLTALLWNAAGYVLVGANADIADADVYLLNSTIETLP